MAPPGHTSFVLCAKGMALPMRALVTSKRGPNSSPTAAGPGEARPKKAALWVVSSVDSWRSVLKMGRFRSISIDFDRFPGRLEAEPRLGTDHNLRLT